MPIRDELVAALEPWMTDDLRTYLTEIGEMFAETEMWSEDTEDFEGWAILLDPDRCPEVALPYLAQYVGERLPVGLMPPYQREWIKDAPNLRRGTPLAIFQAAQRTLTGGRLVAMVERTNWDGAMGQMWAQLGANHPTWQLVSNDYGTWGDVEAEPDDENDHLTVITYTSETPDPARVLADLLTVVPADLVLHYETLTGQNWGLLAAEPSTDTWSEVNTVYANWGEVATDLVGDSVYTRPPP